MYIQQEKVFRVIGKKNSDDPGIENVFGSRETPKYNIFCYDPIKKGITIMIFSTNTFIVTLWSFFALVTQTRHNNKKYSNHLPDAIQSRQNKRGEGN